MSSSYKGYQFHALNKFRDIKKCRIFSIFSLKIKIDPNVMLFEVNLVDKSSLYERQQNTSLMLRRT